MATRWYSCFTKKHQHSFADLFDFDSAQSDKQQATKIIKNIDHCS